MFDVLDKVISIKRQRMEEERKRTLAATLDLLNELSDEFGYDSAYIFGSLVKQGRFNKDSDVDLAVDNVATEKFFKLIARASVQLNRNVDLVVLNECPFVSRIYKEGLAWKRQL